MTRPRVVTDEAILDAARSCALERGPHVALDVIAERVGVTSPALLKRFGTRRELMIAALRPADPPEWVRSLERGPDNRPLGVQLQSLFGTILESLAHTSPCISALSESGIPYDEIYDRKEPPPPVRNTWALAEWFERARLRGLVRSADFETVALAILGALHGRVFLTDFFGKSWWRASRDEYVSDLAKLYEASLAPTASGEHLRPVKTRPSRPRRATKRPSKKGKS